MSLDAPHTAAGARGSSLRHAPRGASSPASFMGAVVCSASMDDAEARAQRARARAGWTVTRTSLAQPPDDDLSALSISERMALVWQLTLDAWAMTGQEIPAYERSRMPGKLVRRGKPDP